MIYPIQTAGFLLEIRRKKYVKMRDFHCDRFILIITSRITWSIEYGLLIKIITEYQRNLSIMTDSFDETKGNGLLLPTQSNFAEEISAFVQDTIRNVLLKLDQNSQLQVESFDVHLHKYVERLVNDIIVKASVNISTSTAVIDEIDTEDLDKLIFSQSPAKVSPSSKAYLKKQATALTLNSTLDLNDLLDNELKEMEDFDNVINDDPTNISKDFGSISPHSRSGKLDNYDDIISSFRAHSRKSFSINRAGSDKLVPPSEDLQTSQSKLEEDKLSPNEEIIIPESVPADEYLVRQSPLMKDQGVVSDEFVLEETRFTSTNSQFKTSFQSPMKRKVSSFGLGRRRSTQPNILFPKKELNLPFQFLSNIQHQQRKNVLNLFWLSLQEKFLNAIKLQQRHSLYYDAEEISTSANRTKLFGNSFLNSPIPLHEIHASYHEVKQFYHKVCMKSSASGQNLTASDQTKQLDTIFHYVSDAYLTAFQKVKLLQILKKVEKQLSNFLMKVTEKVHHLYEGTEEEIASYQTIEQHCQRYYQFNPGSMKQVHIMDYLEYVHAPEKCIDSKIHSIIQALLPNNSVNERDSSATKSMNYVPSILMSKSKSNLYRKLSVSESQLASQTPERSQANHNQGQGGGEAIITTQSNENENELNKSHRYHIYKKKEYYREFKFGQWNNKLEKKYETLISLQTHFDESIKIRKSSNKMLKRHIKKQLKKMTDLSKELEDIGYNPLDLKTATEIDKKFASSGSDDESNEEGGENMKRIEKPTPLEELNEEDEILFYTNDIVQDRRGNYAEIQIKDHQDSKSKGLRTSLETFSELSLEGFDENGKASSSIKDHSRENEDLKLVEGSIVTKRNKSVDVQPGRIRPRSANPSAIGSKLQKTNSKPTRPQSALPSSSSRGKARTGSPYLVDPFKIPDIDIDANIFLDDKPLRSASNMGNANIARPSSPYLTKDHKALLAKNKLNTRLASKIRLMNADSHEKQYHIYRGVSLRYENLAGNYNPKLVADVTKHQQSHHFLSHHPPPSTQTLSASGDHYDDFNLRGTGGSDANLVSNSNLNSSFKPVRMTVREIRSAMKRGYALSGLFNSKSKIKTLTGTNSEDEENENQSPSSDRDDAVPNSLFEIQNLPLKDKKKSHRNKSFMSQSSGNSFVNTNKKSVYNFEKLHIELDNVFAVDKEIDEIHAKNKESEQILQSLFYNPAKPTKYAMTDEMIRLYGFSPKKAMQIFGGTENASNKDEKKSKPKKELRKVASKDNEDLLHELLFGKKPPQKSLHPKASQSTLPPSSSPSPFTTPQTKFLIVPEQMIYSDQNVAASDGMFNDQNFQETNETSFSPKQVTWQREEENSKQLLFDQNLTDTSNVEEDKNTLGAPSLQPREFSEKVDQSSNDKRENIDGHNTNKNGTVPPWRTASKSEDFSLRSMERRSMILMKRIVRFFHEKGLIFGDGNGLDDKEMDTEDAEELNNARIDEKLESNEKLASLAEKYKEKLKEFTKRLKKQQEQLHQQLNPLHRRNSQSSLGGDSVLSFDEPETSIDLMEAELKDLTDLIFLSLPEFMCLIEEFLLRPYLESLFSTFFLNEEVRCDLVIFFIKKCLHYTRLADSGVLTIPLDRTNLMHPVTQTAINLKEEANSSKPSSKPKSAKKTPIIKRKAEEIGHKENQSAAHALHVLVPNDYHDHFISTNAVTTTLPTSLLSPHRPHKHFPLTPNWDENSVKIRELLYYDESAPALKLHQPAYFEPQGSEGEDELLPHDNYHNFLYQLHNSKQTYHTKPFLTGTNPYTAYHPLGHHHKKSTSIYHSQTHYDYNTTHYYEQLIERKEKSLQASKDKNNRNSISSPTLPTAQSGTGEVVKSAVLMKEKGSHHNKTLEKYLENANPFLPSRDASVKEFQEKQEKKNLLLSKHPQFLDNKINNFFYLIHNLQKQIYQMLFNHIEMQILQQSILILYFLFHEFYYLIYQQFSLFLHQNLLQGRKSIFPKTPEEVLSYAQLFSKELFHEQLKKFLTSLSSFFPNISQKIQEFLWEKYSLQDKMFDLSIDQLEKMIQENVEQAKEYMELIQKT